MLLASIYATSVTISRVLIPANKGAHDDCIAKFHLLNLNQFSVEVDFIMNLGFT